MTRRPSGECPLRSTAGGSMRCWCRPRARTIAAPRGAGRVRRTDRRRSRASSAAPCRRRGLRRSPRRHARRGRASRPPRTHARIAALTGPVARRSGRERLRRPARRAPRARPTRTRAPHRQRARCRGGGGRGAPRARRRRRRRRRSSPAASRCSSATLRAARQAPPCRRPRSRARRLGRRAARRALAAADRGGRPRPARPRRRGRDACAEAARPWRCPLRGTGPGRRPAGAVHSPPLAAAIGSIGTYPWETSHMADVFVFAPERRALVTGGASGLGLGTARALLDIGARVAIADLPAALDRMDAAERSRFVPIAMDVTDDASVASGVAGAAKALGGLDTLVNSAGVFQFRALEGIATARVGPHPRRQSQRHVPGHARGDAAPQGVEARAGRQHRLRRRQERLRPSRRLLRVEVRRGRPDPGGRRRGRAGRRPGQRGLPRHRRRNRHGTGGRSSRRSSSAGAARRRRSCGAAPTPSR